jgi:hypothetical protein
MSLIEELGAVLHSTSADLPLGPLVAALDRLQATSALLMWIRTESTSPLGVPQLTSATEHLEQAGRAMQVAQEEIAGYLTALGLHYDAQTPPQPALPPARDDAKDAGGTPGGGPPGAGDPDATDDPAQRDGAGNRARRDGPDRASRPDGTGDPGRAAGGDRADRPDSAIRPDGAGQPDNAAGPDGAARPDSVVRPDGEARPDNAARRDRTRGADTSGGRDDADRVTGGGGTGGSAPAVPLARWWAQRVAVLTDGPAEEAPSGQPAGQAPELLRAVARHTRSGDRDGLRRELARVAPPVGLDLAAITPSLLHRLAGDLLGHQPRGADLAELRRATGDRIHALLPQLPPDVVDAQLSRACRVPPPERTGAPAHPTDSAVTGAVLVGALLARLGRDPDSLDPAPDAHAIGYSHG